MLRSCGQSVDERIWFSSRFSAHPKSDEQRVGGRWRRPRDSQVLGACGIFSSSLLGLLPWDRSLLWEG